MESTQTTMTMELDELPCFGVPPHTTVKDWIVWDIRPEGDGFCLFLVFDGSPKAYDVCKLKHCFKSRRSAEKTAENVVLKQVIRYDLWEHFI